MRNVGHRLRRTSTRSTSSGPDFLIRRGVPKGTIKGPVTLPSQVYPGVAHDYWVYVPAQYDGKTEVSLMVFNDGATYMQPDGYYRAQRNGVMVLETAVVSERLGSPPSLVRSRGGQPLRGLPTVARCEGLGGPPSLALDSQRATVDNLRESQ